jgi:hypothetical protein
MPDELKITFPGATSAEANRFAGELRDVLRGVDRNVSVDRIRDRPDTQDFGATLVLVLGTASATAIAKGLQSWLARTNGARIQISRDGTVIAQNIESKDAAKIAEVVFKMKGQM